MKTISKREGKNYEIEVKGDLHKYPDGSVHTVKEGKAVWEEGSGGSGGSVLMVTDTDGTLDKTMGEIQDAYLAGKRVIIIAGGDGGVALETFDVIGMFPVTLGKGVAEGTIKTYDIASIRSEFALVPKGYSVSGETEEAARNAYPVRSE